jgi:hypothetical protein
LAVRHADFPKFRNLELTGEALPGTKKAKKERYGTEIEEQTHALSSQNKFIISYSDHQLENEQIGRYAQSLSHLLMSLHHFFLPGLWYLANKFQLAFPRIYGHLIGQL